MSERAEPVDWAGLMRLGLGRMSLSSDTFWSMTPTEFVAAVEGRFGQLSGGEAMSPGRLSQLMQQYPDKGAASDP